MDYSEVMKQQGRISMLFSKTHQSEELCYGAINFFFKNGETQTNAKLNINKIDIRYILLNLFFTINP